MKTFSVLIGVAVISACSVTVSFGQNYKIKQTTTMMGQNMSSTIYVKASRKRTEQGGIMGMGGDMASIEQCDLRRTVHVNDKKKLYTIEPFASDEGGAAPVRSTTPAPKATPQKTIKGGTLTMTTSVNDTGERKQMFGLTARHIKTSMKMEPSPDACNKQSMNMESDGWYVDLPQFSCPMTPPQNPMARMGSQPSGGCQDRIVLRSSGGARLGFPLQLTQTMNSEGQDFSISTETIEFSKATLDDALFDIPAGYSLANSQSDLYGKPDYSAMAQAAKNGGGSRNSSDGGFGGEPVRTSAAAAKRPGTKRIGVLMPTNQTSETFSTSNVQSSLIQRLTSGNVDAVAVRSEAEARAANCDYLLSSQVSKLKQSTAGKIGGMFGKVMNTGSPGGSFDGQVDFSLTSLSNGQSVIQNKAAAKVSGNADAAAQDLISQEAGTVLGAIR